MDILFTRTALLYAQVEFRHDLKLTNGYIYAINDFNLFVIVKYGALSKDTGTCVCPAVIYHRCTSQLDDTHHA